MLSILVSLALTIPLTARLTTPLNEPAFLNQPEFLRSGNPASSQPFQARGRNIHKRAVSAGVAPAIAQIFPDITSLEAQRLLQADSLIRLGLIEDGIALYEEELQRFHEQGDHQEEVATLNALASSLEYQGLLQRAAIYYQRALDLYDGGADSFGSPDNYAYELSELVKRLGAVYLALEETEQALTAYEQGLAIARRALTPWGQANILSQMGIAYRLAEQPDQALTAYQQALTYYQDLGGNSYNAPLVWNRIGLIYLAQGQFEPALTAYQQGLDAITDPQESFQVVNRILTLENISHLYEVRGQTEQATAYAQQAETALSTPPEDGVSPAGDSLRQALILENVGEFYLAERDFDRANRYFERALAIAHQSLNAPYDESSLLGSITLHYTRAGQPGQAIPYEERRLEVLREAGLPVNNAESLAGLAQAYQRAGQWERALATYQQALTTFEESQQEFGEQTTNIARIFQQMGQIYETGEQFEPALTAYQQALAQYQKAMFPYGQIFVLERLANLHERQGRGDQAQQYTQQAQTLRDEMRSNPMY
ncbi:tetratricopeptide repeat protein [Leptolyngbya sp. FACHB-16]|uniref:tetratricopeptide repeat protein n=1 Tax=unclassified Leptolyngbya TaxID=2650499 RepID=UPI001687EE9E|nr:tetratricopeptide repeat protein [Leptolyngbya sp. FACHB-16]MBD2156166.1 tetratricopeptide repeat protein [Leptolyngbya sp. FACHB-16]